MPLPAAAPRQIKHTRPVTYRGYLRDDGLWDIEGEMRDLKSEVFDIPGEGVWQPGEPLHNMAIRVTVDERLVVQDIAVAMDDFPHQECPSAQDSMRRMIGCAMGPGWRQAIDRNLKGVQGCAHLRELLFNMATVAFQTIPSSFEPAQGQPPLHLGKCKAWDFDGPLVERQLPMFFQWKAKP